jgi:hypothetical protein
MMLLMVVMARNPGAICEGRFWLGDLYLPRGGSLYPMDAEHIVDGVGEIKFADGSEVLIGRRRPTALAFVIVAHFLNRRKR